MEEISSKNLTIELFQENMNYPENAKPNETVCDKFTYGNKNSK